MLDTGNGGIDRKQYQHTKARRQRNGSPELVATVQMPSSICGQCVTRIFQTLGLESRRVRVGVEHALIIAGVWMRMVVFCPQVQVRL